MEKQINLDNWLIKIKDRLLKCTRCGHIWIQKNKFKKPRRCSACNSPYWDRPRQKDLKISLIKNIEF